MHCNTEWHPQSQDQSLRRHHFSKILLRFRYSKLKLMHPTYILQYTNCIRHDKITQYIPKHTFNLFSTPWSNPGAQEHLFWHISFPFSSVVGSSKQVWISPPAGLHGIFVWFPVFASMHGWVRQVHSGRPVQDFKRNIATYCVSIYSLFRIILTRKCSRHC